VVLAERFSLDIGVSVETPGGPNELFGWTVITLIGSHLRSSRMAPCVSAPVAVTRRMRVNSGMSSSSVVKSLSRRKAESLSRI
jgi:hypothetical protein